MIDQKVAELAEKRKILAIRQEELQRLQDHISRVFGDKLEKMQQIVKDARTDAAQAESELKEFVLEKFHAVEIVRKPHTAIQIKQWTVLVYDPKEAKQYCLDHLPGALTMKKAAFERVAKVVEPDFVTVDTEDRVSISRDLSAWLSNRQADA